MVTLPYFLEPGNSHEIDAGNNWQPGPNDLLETGETGYSPLRDSLSETLAKEFIGPPFPTVDEVELLDGARGFSALERSLVHRFVQGFHKWNRVYAQPHLEALKNSRYTRPENPPPETFLPHYWSSLKFFFVGPERLELTDANLTAVWEALASGIDIGLGRSKRAIFSEAVSDNLPTFGCLPNLSSRPSGASTTERLTQDERGAVFNDAYIQNLGRNYFTNGAFFTLDLMNLINMVGLGGEFTVRALLTAQRAGFRVGIDQIEAPDFGEMVVYQGLDDDQIAGALSRAGGSHVEIAPQGALWKTTPITQDRAVKAIAERVRKTASPTKPLPKTEDEIRAIMSIMDNPFKGYGYVFATFDNAGSSRP